MAMLATRHEGTTVVGSERRRSYRVHPGVASAICRAKPVSVRCRVEDLSAGGIRLSGPVTFPDGAALEVVLRLGGLGEFVVAGRVVRQIEVAHGASFAVAFAELSPDAEEAIDQMVVDQYTARRQPLAIIVGSPVATARRLGRQLRAEGYRTCAVRAPLDLIRVLDSEANVGFVLLGERLGPIPGSDVRSFVAEHRPGVRCVTLPAATPLPS